MQVRCKPAAQSPVSIGDTHAHTHARPQASLRQQPSRLAVLQAFWAQARSSCWPCYWTFLKPCVFCGCACARCRQRGVIANLCVCVAHVQCLLWDFDGTGGASDTKTVVTPGAAWADVLLEPGTSTLAKGHAHQRSLHCTVPPFVVVWVLQAWFHPCSPSTNRSSSCTARRCPTACARSFCL